MIGGDTSAVAYPVAVPNPALRYYGAKFRIGRKIADLLPTHVTYVEPFGGAAGVLLKKPVSTVEVYNDLDGRVVNFFRILRKDAKALARAVSLTPYSRSEFDDSFDRSEDPMEDARRFFTCSWQSFGGPNRSTGWKIQVAPWNNSRANQCKEWRSACRNLLRVAKRFRTVQVEHYDALKVITRFDSPDTVFYCDPPYPASTRNSRWCQSGYAHEFTSQDHVHLANLLSSIQGMALVSTYPNALYEDLFSEWRRIEFTSQTMNKTIATELVYLSPRCP